MATPSSTISRDFPTRSPAIHIQPQSWGKWTVNDSTVKKAVIAIAAVIFLYAIYRLTRPVPKVKKTIIPFPPEQLNAKGFIQISQDCLGNNLRDITKVKVIIEDTKGRRIATRYMPGIYGCEDVFSPLPLGEKVNVCIEVACKWGGAKTKSSQGPFEFTVDQERGKYHISAIWRSLSEKVEAVVGEGRALQVAPTELKALQFNGREVILSADRTDMIQGYVDPETISLESKDKAYYVVDIKIRKFSFEEIPSLFYSVFDNKELKLRWLIKDWKAAYQLQTGKSFSYVYKEGSSRSDFSIESISQESYQPSQLRS